MAANLNIASIADSPTTPPETSQTPPMVAFEGTASLTKLNIVGIIAACLFALFVGYLGFRFYPWSYYAVGIVLLLITSAAFAARMARNAARTGDPISLLQDFINNQIPLWRRVLNYTKLGAFAVAVVLAWPIWLPTMLSAILMVHFSRTQALPPLQQSAASNFLAPRVHIIFCSFLVLCSVSLVCFVNTRAVTVSHDVLAVFIAYNIVLALFFMYTSYLADLKPIQRRFRGWDANVHVQCLILIVAHLVTLSVGAYIIFLSETNELPSLKSFQDAVLGMLAYEELWNPSSWSNATTGTLVVGATTTAFALSLVHSFRQLKEFTRTDDDWITIAANRTQLGKPDLALKALANIEEHNFAARISRANALLELGNPGEAWHQISTANRGYIDLSNVEDVDLTYLGFQGLACIWATKTSVAMRAFNFAISQHFSDGRIAIFLSNLASVSKFDPELMEIPELQKYPLVSAVMKLLLDQPEEAENFIDGKKWSDSSDSVDAVVKSCLSVLTFLRRRAKHSSKAEFLQELDEKIEDITRDAEKKIMMTSKLGTKALLIANLTDLLYISKENGSAYTARLSSIIDLQVNVLRESGLPTKFIKMLEFRKDRAAKVII